jgi:hypothetical protein
MTTQHLISDGFDIGTGRDPTKTSFQELATYVSHNKMAQMAGIINCLRCAKDDLVVRHPP